MPVGHSNRLSVSHKTWSWAWANYFLGYAPYLFSPLALYAQKHTQARTYTHKHEHINIQAHILLPNRAAHLQCVQKKLSLTFTIEYLPHKHSAYTSKCTYARMYAHVWAHVCAYSHLLTNTNTNTHMQFKLFL